MKTTAFLPLAVILLATPLLAADAPAPIPTLQTSTWGMNFSNFFREGAPLNLYPSRRDGKWIAAVGTSRLPGRNHYSYNTARYLGDMSGVVVEGETFKGTIKLLLGPDPWVPADRKPRTVTIEVDGKFTAPSPTDKKAIRGITGTYTAQLEAGIRKEGNTVSGTIGGGVGPTEIGPLDNVTYSVMLQDLIPGGKPTDNQRRIWLGLGVRDGKVISAQFGPVNMRHAPYAQQFIEPPTDFVVNQDGLKGTVEFPIPSLDGEMVKIAVKIEGGRVQGMLIGTYTATCTSPSGQVEKRGCTFDGNVNPGAADNKYVKDERPWFVAVKDWKPVPPGEHPRLFFRKSDLPELRRRAATPEGQVIIKRLRELLDGKDGETMTTLLNPAKKGYEGKFKGGPGAYSISHAAGYAFLYQLTGDKKYAEFARQCVELAFNGQRDFDDRYSWAVSSGELRAGPSIAWYAAAYDLGYDAWPEDFRVKFAQAIQNYNSVDAGDDGQAGDKEGISIRKLALAPRHGPNSNHYGAVAGGGLAVLAIKGDPGTDAALVDRYDVAFQDTIRRAFSGGFGDGGFFFEGMGPGQIFSDTAFIPYIQALKTAQGRDYINGPRPNVANVTMVRVWELIGPPAVYPHRSSMSGSYGGPNFTEWRNGLSRGGQFVQGFGAVREAEKPAVLWCFNHVVEPDQAKYTYDTVSGYPHRALLALINWPTFTGIQEKNPAEVLPKFHRDTAYDYFVFRNRWQDKDDTVVTALLNPPNSGIKPRGVMIWGLGEKVELPAPMSATVRAVDASQDRSAILHADGFQLAVDFSKTSGAEVLVIAAGSGPVTLPAKGNSKGQATNVKLAGQDCVVFTLAANGQHPEVKADGDTLTIGKQTAKLADGKLTLGVFTPDAKVK